jgi:hypothetical protein
MICLAGKLLRGIYANVLALADQTEPESANELQKGAAAYTTSGKLGVQPVGPNHGKRHKNLIVSSTGRCR